MNPIAIQKTLSGKGLWVFGQTFPHKNQLKEMGGKWNASRKSWVFQVIKLQELLDYFKLTENDVGQEEKNIDVGKTIQFKVGAFFLFSQHVMHYYQKQDGLTEEEISRRISMDWNSLPLSSIDGWCRKAGDR